MFKAVLGSRSTQQDLYYNILPIKDLVASDESVEDLPTVKPSCLQVSASMCIPV